MYSFQRIIIHKFKNYTNYVNANDLLTGTCFLYIKGCVKVEQNYILTDQMLWK